MRKPLAAAPAEPVRSPYHWLTVGILCAGIVIIPLYVARDAWDPWRLPKELAFRAEAILLLFAGTIAATARRTKLREEVSRVGRTEWAVCGGIAIWTVLATITSSNRILSLDSLVTLAAGLVIYIASRLAVPRLSFAVIGITLIPGAANAVLAILQEYGVWNPYEFPQLISGHTRTTGFMGNPNDVGSFLVGPAIAAVVAMLLASGWTRWLYMGFSLLIIAGIVASATRTALIALMAGVIVLAMLRPWKQALLIAAAGVAILIAAMASSLLLRESFVRLAGAARGRNYQVLLSARAVPFLAAIEMARSHPVTGVGPGGFKFHFMQTRISMEEKYPATVLQWAPENYGETHNDHLQVAAEIGLPGYALFLAAMIAVAIVRWRAVPAGAPPLRTEERYARMLAMPLAVTFFVLSLAQFPLQIAPPRLLFLTFAALVRGWERRDA